MRERKSRCVHLLGVSVGVQQQQSAYSKLTLSLNLGCLRRARLSVRSLGITEEVRLRACLLQFCPISSPRHSTTMPSRQSRSRSPQRDRHRRQPDFPRTRDNGYASRNTDRREGDAGGDDRRKHDKRPRDGRYTEDDRRGERDRDRRRYDEADERDGSVSRAGSSKTITRDRTLHCDITESTRTSKVPAKAQLWKLGSPSGGK